MTDNSKLTLRWEIDNAIAKFATGKVESEVFVNGGFKWTLTAERQTFPRENRTDFTLRCEANHNGPWNCEVEVDMHQIGHNGKTDAVWIKERFCFGNSSSCLVGKCNFWYWSSTTKTDWLISGKVLFECLINIIRSEGREQIADLRKFAVPNRRSDVVLKVGEERLHVSKEFLAVHSPVFEALFFGDYSEKGKEEVEMKDVVYEEFLDLLHLLHFGTMKITDRTVLHILKLTDRFQMQLVMDQAKMHIIQSNGFDTMAKLLIADQYNLSDLRDHCLKSFTTSTELVKRLQACPEFAKFSMEMKNEICKKIVGLKFQMTGKSKFALRWEIGNAVARLATGKVESGVFEEGGFKWTITGKREVDSSKKMGFVLHCDPGHNRPWKCEGEVDIHLIKVNGGTDKSNSEQDCFLFNAESCSWIHRSIDWEWKYITDPKYIVNDMVTLEFHINIISSDRGDLVADLNKFASPNNKSNVILLIGDKKLHVSKELLAINSPVFDTLFFGDFSEKGKEEVEIKDVVFEQFVDLLHVVYPGRFKITDSTVSHILALADRFQMEDSCLRSYKTVREIGTLESTPEFANFSDGMKAAICVRMMKLVKLLN